MVRASWKVGTVALILAGIGYVIFGLLFGLPHFPAVSGCFERITGETPQFKVEAYIDAVIRGDSETAVGLWELAGLSNPEQYRALSKRRQEVTNELLQKRTNVDPSFIILNTEWWTTCCEPHVICDSREAGGARIRVQFIDSTGKPFIYVFDVFVRETSYWGSAAGYPPRHWVIRDIYPESEEPLFWRWIYKPFVEYLEWKPAAR